MNNVINVFYFMLLLVSTVFFTSIGERQKLMEDNALLSIGDIFPMSDVSGGLDTLTGIYQYDYIHRNRPVGTLLGLRQDGNDIDWRFVPEYTIPSVYASLEARSITDFLMTGWYNKKFIYEEGTRRSMKKYMESTRSNLAYLIYKDKVQGMVPWQFAVITGYLESKGISQVSKKANNDHGIKCNKHTRKQHIAAVKASEAAGRSTHYLYDSKGNKTCYWGGGDRSPSEGKYGKYGHYRYFNSPKESIDAHQAILMSQIETSVSGRYKQFNDIPFNNEIYPWKVKIYGDKTVRLHGQKLIHNELLLLPGIDIWAGGASASVYASDPDYADKIIGIYWSVFGDWTLDDFYFFEELYVPELKDRHAQTTTPQIAETEMGPWQSYAGPD